MAVSYTTDWFLAGLGVFIFVIGVVLYFAHGYQKLKYERSITWPSVVGTIVASAVEAGSAGKNTAYRAAIRYRYRIGDTEHESSRVFWGPSEGRREAMDKLVADYPVGKDVWVQYDPADASRAVLRPDIPASLNPLFYYALGMMLLGLIALGAGLYALSH